MFMALWAKTPRRSHAVQLRSPQLATESLAAEPMR
jgi:hypothetical protein